MVGTRRALLGAGAAVALAAAGCGGRERRARPGDAATLGRLHAGALAAAAAWAAAPASPGVPASELAARERAHADALARAGAAAGAPAAGVRAAAGRLRAAGTPQAGLALARVVADERLAALADVRARDARALVVGLYAAAAQAQAVLRAAAGEDPLPDAFAGSLA